MGDGLEIALGLGAGVFGMEIVAHLAHRYVMHGFLWRIHRDHHRPGHGFFQLNDTFFLIFAVPAWLCIQIGLQRHVAIAWATGFGITLYGIIYVLIHELLVHRRFKWIPVPKIGYWARLVRAHHRHHAQRDQGGGRNFGLLWFK